METAKVTAKGQITIPKAIREALSVSRGDVLAFRIDDRIGVRVFPVRNAPKPLRGFLADAADATDAGKRDDAWLRTTLRRRAATKHART